MFFCPPLLFSFVSLPPLLICEGLPFLPSFCVCRFFLRRGGRRAVFFFFFFSIFARQEREMLGGTAVRNLQQSESGSCLWMSVSLSALLDAPVDILHEWCLAVCFPLPGRQRCFIAAGFKETHGLFFPLCYPFGRFIDSSAWETCHSCCVCLSIIHVVQPGLIAGDFRQTVI